MTDKIQSYWPIAMVTVIHILAVGTLYGSLTTEMKVFNSSLINVVKELKEINSHVNQLKENDIRLEYLHKSTIDRVERLEDYNQ